MFSLFPSFAQAQDDGYKLPPEISTNRYSQIDSCVGVSINKKAEWMLLIERNSYPSVEDWHKNTCIGLRINPNKLFRPVVELYQ